MNINKRKAFFVLFFTWLCLFCVVTLMARMLCFRKRTKDWSWWIFTTILFPATTRLTSLMWQVSHLFSLESFFFFFYCKLKYSVSYNVNDSLFHTAFADHFDHIKKVIGAESIGIGGDFEGAKRWEIFISQHNIQHKSQCAFSLQTNLYNCTLLTLL